MKRFLCLGVPRLPQWFLSESPKGMMTHPRMRNSAPFQGVLLRAALAAVVHVEHLHDYAGAGAIVRVFDVDDSSQRSPK